MDNPGAVRGFQTQRHLTKDIQRFIYGEPRFLEALPECLALVERHHDEELAALFADVMDVGDVGMVQGTGGARFSNKASLGGFVGNQMPRQKLDRDGARQLEVRRSIQNSHPACPEPLVQAIVRKHAADERVDRERRLSREHLLRTLAQVLRLLGFSSRRHAGILFTAAIYRWRTRTKLHPRPGGGKRNSTQG